MSRLPAMSLSVQWLVCAIAIGLFCLDAALVLQNRTLKRELRSGGTSLAPPLGATVPGISGVDLAGHPVTLTPSSGKSLLLFVFSPDCAVCDQTWPKWEVLLPKIDTRRFSAVFASSGPGLTRAFASEHGISGYPVLRAVDPATVIALNLRLAPKVLEFTPQGKLHAAWVGGLDRDSFDHMAGELGASVYWQSPGLQGDSG